MCMQKCKCKCVCTPAHMLLQATNTGCHSAGPLPYLNKGQVLGDDLLAVVHDEHTAHLWQYRAWHVAVQVSVLHRPLAGGLMRCACTQPRHPGDFLCVAFTCSCCSYDDSRQYTHCPGCSSCNMLISDEVHDSKCCLMPSSCGPGHILT
jgi:hypothetical protein